MRSNSVPQCKAKKETSAEIRSAPSKIIEIFRKAKERERIMGVSAKSVIVKECVIRLSVRRKGYGGKPTKYPSLRKLPVAEMTAETITGECVCIPYSKENYISLHQAGRHLMAANPGWKFLIRKIPATDTEPERACIWRIR